MSERVITPPRAPKHSSEVEINKGIKWSAIAHLALLAIIILKSLVFPGKPIVYIPSLRVDIVGLPDVLKSEKMLSKNAPTNIEEMKKQLQEAETGAKNIKIPPSAKEEIKKDDMTIKPLASASEKNRQKRLKNALSRIKALAKITGEQDSAISQPIKGNMISHGSSISGEARETGKAGYLDTLRERLQDNWALPVWVARQRLSAQVQIHINSRGRLESFKFIKLSGNSQFDDAVKKTLIESQPFPLPPPDLVGRLISDGILVGFPL